MIFETHAHYDDDAFDEDKFYKKYKTEKTILSATIPLVKVRPKIKAIDMNKNIIQISI